MWIDFKIVFFVRNHKAKVINKLLTAVVNWFQNCIFREESQDMFWRPIEIVSCELISKLYFSWGITRNEEYLNTIEELWIDFKIVFFVRNHKFECVTVKPPCVVNWFQNCIFREESQESSAFAFLSLCCELISKLYFSWGITSLYFFVVNIFVLWIDFKIVFFVRNHKQFVHLLF